MHTPTESDDTDHSRFIPSWVRSTVWFIAALLVVSVIGGMFVY